MSISKLRRYWVVLGLFCLVCALATPVMAQATNGACAFAMVDQIVVTGVAPANPEDRFWFQVRHENRPLASGLIQGHASNKGISLPVQLPEVKPGVFKVLHLRLCKGDDKGLQVYDGPLTVYSPFPYAEGERPAGEKTVVVYDPDGKTIAALQNIRFPFEAIKQLSDVRTNQVLVIGEGIERTRLFDPQVLATVRRGADVLMLAPLSEGGSIPLGEWDQMKAENFMGSATVQGGSFFNLMPERGRCVFSINGEKGARQVHWRDLYSKASFSVYGIPIISAWDKSAEARWMFKTWLTTQQEGRQHEKSDTALHE